jgi:hypothetical protein
MDLQTTVAVVVVVPAAQVLEVVPLEAQILLQEILLVAEESEDLVLLPELFLQVVVVVATTITQVE